ncbi:M4 family metallopeptidase [Kitasatospora sp. NBC_00240]|uniref:M4 family metallopeptidase n=1 Tax=Kitasatospora sp. NBC_00240 TaxID=2903567 RepID=UPI002251D80C|nr:M4 family metallopeptidase [Kitasatospora sp. NBC_00240]MCX5208865.1 M4 family metallopeptidase [Kitasatospora sp. NBC_00240]
MVAVALPAGIATADPTPEHGPAAQGATAGTSPAPRAGALAVALAPGERSALLADAQSRRATTAKALGLGAQEDLQAKSVLKDADGTLHTRYDRTFAGLPVLGGDLVVHTAPDGTTKGVDKATRETIAVASTAETATAGSAEEFAVGRARSEGAKDAKADSVRKVVWAASGTPVLAWESVVGGLQHDGTPSELHVVTDARTGAKLFEYQDVKNGIGNSQYSGQVTIGTAGSGSSYSMTDNTRGGHKTYDLNHVETDDVPGTLFTDTDDVWGNSTTASAQTAGVDAQYGAQLTWDFYKNVLGRNGIQNNGVAAHSRVHYGDYYVNAYWWDGCFCMTYGDGDGNANPLTSIDVAAHEMTHGVTSATANLNYSNESGGLNEATSDIMATAVEFWANNAADPGDYLIGEKINIDGDGKPLRYMDQPSKDGWSADYWSSSVGSNDVHFSSGVANHWFYLASEGSGAKLVNGVNYNSPTYDGLPVNPIGRDAASRIWYRALSTYMTSNTNYAGARTATLQAAADLYGTGTPAYKNTANAWAAVNVGARITQGVTVTNPGDQVTRTGTAVSLQTKAVSSNPGALTYTATGLPAGLTLNASTGKITGTPTTQALSTVTLTVKDTTGALDVVSFGWTTYTVGQCTVSQQLANPGFESGTTAWYASGPRVIDSTNPYTLPRSGSWKAFLDGYGSTHTDTLSQTVYVPWGCKATLTFWVFITTDEGTKTVPYDKLTVQAGETVLATYSNLNATTGYVQKTVDLSAYAGQYVNVQFVGKEDLAARTTFLIDDTQFMLGN